MNTENIFIVTYEFDTKAIGRDSAVLKGFRKFEDAFDYYKKVSKNIKEDFCTNRGYTIKDEEIGVEENVNTEMQTARCTIDYNQFEEWEEVCIKSIELC